MTHVLHIVYTCPNNSLSGGCNATNDIKRDALLSAVVQAKVQYKSLYRTRTWGSSAFARLHSLATGKQGQT